MTSRTCSEHSNGALDAGRDDDLRGARFPGADQSRHDLVSGGSRTQTMMHSCASAAKLRGGGPILFPGMKAKGDDRDPATSNRHRSLALEAGRAETVGGFLCNSAHEAGRRTIPSGSYLPARAATGRSAACVPAPQSWSCGSEAHFSCARKTIAPRRCPSGTSETAMPVGSCRAGPARRPLRRGAFRERHEARGGRRWPVRGV